MRPVACLAVVLVAVACDDKVGRIRIHEIRPSQANNQKAVPVEIVGENFLVIPHSNFNDPDRAHSNTTFTAALGDNPLSEVAFRGRALLVAVVPVGLEPGIYDLSVSDPDGDTARLAAAFEVLGLHDGGPEVDAGPPADASGARDAMADVAVPDGVAPDVALADVALADVAAPAPDLAPALDLAPAPDKGCVASKQQLAITTAIDDGECDHGDVYLPDGELAGPDPVGLYAGWWSGDFTWVYLRFSLTASIPGGASITAAELAMWGIAAPVANASWNPATHALRVFAEDASDAQAVTSNKDCPSGAKPRPMTTTKVRWPAAGGLAWKVDGYNTITTLAPAIQELVDRYDGLQAGAHLQLWIRSDFANTNAEVVSQDFKNPLYKATTLTIGWCP
jgi:hypothetical protein